MLTSEYEGRLSELLSRLSKIRRNTPNKEVVEVCGELLRLGVSYSGTIRPRGLLDKTTGPRLPEGKHEDILIQLLKTRRDSGARSAVIGAMSEWGDEKSAKALARIFTSEKDNDCRKACIHALSMIGGQTAAAKLKSIENDPGNLDKTIRFLAATGYEDLMTGGALDMMMPPPNIKRHTLLLPDILNNYIAGAKLWRDYIISEIERVATDPRKRRKLLIEKLTPYKESYPKFNWNLGLKRLSKRCKWPIWAQNIFKNKLL